MEEAFVGQQEINIPAGLLKREQERQQQAKRPEKEGDGFGKTFSENYARIKDQIDKLREVASQENGCKDGKAAGQESYDREALKEKFADINKQLLLLNRVLLDAKIFLPLYEVKTYNGKLGELTEECNALEANLLPRKKFGFRKVAGKLNLGKDEVDVDKVERTTNVEEDKIYAKDDVDFVKAATQVEQSVGFYNRRNETLLLSSEEVNKKPIALCDIDSCTVRIRGNASAVHMNNIKNCNIYLGPVSNSVHIENCVDSTLYLACHQFRMHTSSNCSLYLHCGSQPVVEYCKGIGFAPALNLDEELFKQSGLDRKNLWDHVQDFNWLSDGPSPNWFVIEEAERKDSF